MASPLLVCLNIVCSSESSADDGNLTDLYKYTGDIDGYILASQKSAARGMVHNANPVRIDIHGPKALAESICNITARYEADGVEYEIVAFVRAVSQLELVEEPLGGSVWKLTTMEVIYINDKVVPTAPLAGPCNLDFSNLKNARKSYRYLTWQITRRGGKIRDDLPGVDDEESVREVMERNHKWLQED